MKIKRESLLNAFNAVQPGLAKKEIIEQMAHFIFTGQHLITYNDKVCVSYPFETDFKCSVYAGDFYKIISKIKSEIIDLEHKNDSLIAKSKRTTIKMTTIVEDEVSELLSNLEDQIKEEWTSLPDNFLEGLYLCMFSASKDQTQGTLVCVKVEGDLIQSTDSIRISQFQMSGEVEKMLISASAIPALKGLGVTNYHISKSWLHFLNDNNVRISIRTVHGEFPDSSKFFKMKGTRLKLPSELKDALETVGIMAEGDITTDKVVNVVIDNQQMILTSKKERGSIEKIVPIKYNRDKIEFTSNPVFLAQILGNATKMTIAKHAIFESKTFKHLLALYN